MITYNHDIKTMCSYLDRVIKELVHSVSSGVSEVNEFDMERVLSYLGKLRSFHAWVVAQPQLDIPETDPDAQEIPEAEAIPALENEAIANIIRLLQVSRKELLNAQSARKPCGMISFDSRRLLAILSKTESFVNDFIKNETPIDLPESSPKAAKVGAGNTGA